MRIKSVKRLEIWLEFEFYQIKRDLQKNVRPCYYVAPQHGFESATNIGGFRLSFNRGPGG